MSGWVCPICGLDYDTVNRVDAVVALRSFPRRYGEVLHAVAEETGGDQRLRTRPEPTKWSAVEYTAHVGDIFQELAGAVRDMVREDQPVLESDFDPDQAAVERDYASRTVDRVLSDLDAGAAAVVDAVDGISEDDWARTGTFSFGQRDVLAIVRNAVHEGSHHLRDVGDVIAAVER